MRNATIASLVLSILALPAIAQPFNSIPPDRIPPAGWKDLQGFSSSGWTILDVNDPSDVGAGNVIVPNDLSTDTAEKVESILATQQGPVVLRFPAGDFYLKSHLEITKPKTVLQGAGKGETRINIVAPPASNAEIEFRGGGIGAEVDIVNFPVRGDIAVEVADPGAFDIGDFAHVYDPGKVPKIVISGLPTITYYGQIVRIVEKSGSTLTLDMPLGLDFDADPKIAQHALLEMAGVKDLSVLRSQLAESSRTNNIDFTYVFRGYASNVESGYLEQGGISAFMSKEIVVVNSDIHHAFDYGGGGQAYGIRMFYNTTECRITNNKIWDMRHHIMLDRGANHCIVSYNSAEPGYFGATGDLNIHGFTAHNNLFEGNMGRSLKWDGRSDANADQFQSIWSFGYRNNLRQHSSNEIRVENPGAVGNHSHLYPTILGNATTGILLAPSVDEDLSGNNRINGTVVAGDFTTTGTYPSSLYESQKPSFLGSKPWPLFGPSVTDFGEANTVPAFDRGKVESPKPTLGACLSGTLVGSKPGTYVVQNRALNTYLRATSASGPVVTGDDNATNRLWLLQDQNADGYFGLINEGVTSNLRAHASGSVTTDTGTLSDASRQWELRDGNNDGYYGVISREYEPLHLKGTGTTSNVILEGDPYDDDELWTICP